MFEDILDHGSQDIILTENIDKFQFISSGHIAISSLRTYTY